MGIEVLSVSLTPPRGHVMYIGIGLGTLVLIIILILVLT